MMVNMLAVAAIVISVVVIVANEVARRRMRKAQEIRERINP